MNFEVVRVPVSPSFMGIDKEHYKVRDKRSGKLTSGSYTSVQAATKIADNKHRKQVIGDAVQEVKVNMPLMKSDFFRFEKKA